MEIRKSAWLVGVILSFVSCNTTENKTQQTPVVQKEVKEVEKEEKKDILMFFGNSITAGYGLDSDDAFPAHIQDFVDSLGWNYTVVNAGLSGETTAGGVNRVDWVLKTVPDVFVLELGANDGLRGLDLDETEKNLEIIINKVKAVNPDVKVILAGMEVPPNLGGAYTSRFRSIFPAVADKTRADLIPFILDGVAAIPSLNQPDGIHPTAEGHKIIAQLVWKHLLPVLEKPAP